jgi:hypothetical protein
MQEKKYFPELNVDISSSNFNCGGLNTEQGMMQVTTTRNVSHQPAEHGHDFHPLLHHLFMYLFPSNCLEPFFRNSFVR